MRLPALVLILASATAASNAAKSSEPECNELMEGSTLQESCFLQRDLKGLDAELDATYKELLDQWSSKDFSRERSELDAAQRAWIRYRDKTCSLEQSVHGGTLSISFMRCMSRLTRERVDYLKGLLHQGAGEVRSDPAIEGLGEGDSVRISIEP